MSHESSEGVGDQGAAKGTDSKEGLPGRKPADADLLHNRGHPRNGIYALVGEVGGDVGGAIWMSFLVTILVAFVTAFAYAELVTKYPYAAGAALYVNKAFGFPFLTFVIAFAVVMSGITSASAAGVTFGGDYLTEFVTLPTVAVAVAFLAILSLVNFWGISESVKLNLVFTAIELSGLLIIIVIGLVTVLGRGRSGARLRVQGGRRSAARSAIGG